MNRSCIVEEEDQFFLLQYETLIRKSFFLHPILPLFNKLIYPPIFQEAASYLLIYCILINKYEIFVHIFTS